MIAASTVHFSRFQLDLIVRSTTTIATASGDHASTSEVFVQRRAVVSAMISQYFTVRRITRSAIVLNHLRRRFACFKLCAHLL